MQALRFTATGNLDALILDDAPKPEPARGEVRVAVRAAGLNPSDMKNVMGLFPYTTTPRIPGRDFAGVVEDGPADLIGQEVWGSGKGLGFTRDGSHAGFLTLPADGLSLKPAALSFAQAASCGVPYITALEALERGQVGHGTPLLIIGGGAVARAAAHMARALGAEVLLAARRSTQVEAFSEQGWRALTLPEPAALADEVRALLDRPPEVIFDTTGHWLPAAVEALAPFGHIAVIAAPAGGKVETPILNLYRRGGMILGVNSLLHDLPTSAAMLNRIGAFFERGDITPPTNFQEIPLADGVAAYRELQVGSSKKTVLIPA